MSIPKRSIERMMGNGLNARLYPADTFPDSLPVEDLITQDKDYDRHVLRVFRWRGAWNWKDITERIVAGLIAGLAAGMSFWVMERVFG